MEFVDYQRAEDGSRLRDYYVLRFNGSALGNFPWGDATFDCVLVSANHQRTKQLGKEFANQVVRCNTDWVQTTGPDAELIHDLVDEASVRAGRQHKVGGGSPMTSWHTEATTLEEIAEVAANCLGSSDFVLCVAVGETTSTNRFIGCLRQKLTSSV